MAVVQGVAVVADGRQQDRQVVPRPEHQVEGQVARSIRKVVENSSAVGLKGERCMDPMM